MNLLNIALIFYNKLYFAFFFISYLSIICIYIYAYSFCLPDVVSAVTVLFDMISLVVSIGVMVAEDDEPNKVEFVLIDICDKLSETLH